MRAGLGECLGSLPMQSRTVATRRGSALAIASVGDKGRCQSAEGPGVPTGIPRRRKLELGLVRPSVFAQSAGHRIVEKADFARPDHEEATSGS